MRPLPGKIDHIQQLLTVLGDGIFFFELLLRPFDLSEPLDIVLNQPFESSVPIVKALGKKPATP